MHSIFYIMEVLMDTFNAFNNWLDIYTTYKKPTKSNIVSRLRRANNIIPIIDDPVYLYNLSQAPDFQKLTVSVKSQIRRAVKIYYEFKECEGAKTHGN